ncbi:MAG TPA: hypothetical protein VMB21_11320, partial [Candidatus Limnocylindria bacterium]|nr:hypothetical protein [Candidatus Limnocylindria bacterium]
MRLLRTAARVLAATLLLAGLGVFLWRGAQRVELNRRLARYRAAGLPTTFAELNAWYAPVPDTENAATALL